MKRLIFLLCALVCQSALADVILLKNGDRITGDISSFWDDEVTIEPEYSDEFQVDADAIADIQTDDLVEIEFYIGDDANLQLLGVTPEGQIEVADESGNHRLVNYTNIRRINEVTEHFDWESRVDYNHTVSKGNTNSEAGTVNASLGFNFDDHRHQFDLQMIREEVNNEDTKNNDTLNYTYNWVFDDPWFMAANATYKQDVIALIDSQVSSSLGLGYDIWDSPHRTFNIQAGPGYQSETVDGDTNQSSLIDWRLRFSYKLLAGDLELYHNHRLYKNFQGRENTVFTSVTGLRFDVTDDIYLNVELDYDSDSNPAANTEPADTTFVVGAGYNFD